MGFFNQLLLLLWKNFTLRKRQKLRLVAEIVFPLALFFILLIVRATKPDLKVKHGECHFDAKAMPSAGILPFLQSFMCTFNNTCHEKPTTDALPGVAGSFSQSGLNEAFIALEEILNSEVDVELISDTINDLNILAGLAQKIWNGTAVGNFTLGNRVINPATLRQQILDQNLNLSSDVVDWLLNATLNRQVFVDGLNERSIITFVSSLMPPTFESENATILYIRQKVCNETRLKEIFYFPNESMSDKVHDELCALSPQDFITLGNDFVQDFDQVAFLNELREFAQQNVPNQGQLLLTIQGALLQTLMSNTSWQKPFRDAMAAIQTIRNQSGDVMPGNFSTGSLFQMAGQFVCGRSNALLSIDENQAQQLNEADRQPVNSNLPYDNKATTTKAPVDNSTQRMSKTTPDPVLERLQDRSCIRKTIDGAWSLWSKWTECNATCGGGTSGRFRFCSAAAHGGENCTGPSEEYMACNVHECPIDGVWKEWGNWTECTATSGTGERQRFRGCKGPFYSGANCSGVWDQLENCNTQACPVDGEWNAWAEWSTCNVTCGGGTRWRSRDCSGPFYGGAECPGQNRSAENCNNHECPIDGKLSEWYAAEVYSGVIERASALSLVEPTAQIL